MIQKTWQGCYDASWRDLITDESFSHPAKMARGLIVRIFDHAFAQGWLQKGSVVVDPFGGIGSTGIEAASRGVQAFLCELEPRFVQMARGGRCPGNRWPDGMGIVCSDCAGKRGTERTESHHVTGNFELHRPTWEACGDPLPVIVQGDSRQLVAVLAPAMGAACVIGSPPFQGSLSDNPSPGASTMQADAGHAFGRGCLGDGYGGSPGNLGAMKPGSVADVIVSSPPFQQTGTLDHDGQTGKLQRTFSGGGTKFLDANYGQTPGNLGNLPTGSVDACIGSPPFGEEVKGGTPDSLFTHTDGRTASRKLRGLSSGDGQYGTSPGQLSAMPTGTVDAVVGSPPFSSPDCQPASVRQPGGRQGVRSSYKSAGSDAEDNYGQTEGQLGAMPTGSVEAAVQADLICKTGLVTHIKDGTLTGKGEPVDAENDQDRTQKTVQEDGTVSCEMGSKKGGIDLPLRSQGHVANADRPVLQDARENNSECHGDAGNSAPRQRKTQGGDALQLQTRQEQRSLPNGDNQGQVPQVRNDGEPGDSPQKRRPLRQPTGKPGSALQLLPHERDQAEVVGSEESRTADAQEQRTDRMGAQAEGVNEPITFWHASIDILRQCYAILKPGGIAIFVCKDFVRGGKRVDFSRQWLTACEACGFQPLEWIKASLVKRDEQPGLFGEAIVKTKSKKSFFRRLCEAKGSPAIDHEDVIVLQKP